MRTFLIVLVSIYMLSLVFNTYKYWDFYSERTRAFWEKEKDKKERLELLAEQTSKETVNKIWKSVLSILCLLQMGICTALIVALA